eukprot:evm.model.scf_435.8 EVM.evm.TU.scf_435.8   scf_435:75056-80504(-)
MSALSKSFQRPWLRQGPVLFEGRFGRRGCLDGSGVGAGVPRAPRAFGRGLMRTLLPLLWLHRNLCCIEGSWVPVFCVRAGDWRGLDRCLNRVLLGFLRDFVQALMPDLLPLSSCRETPGVLSDLGCPRLSAWPGVCLGLSVCCAWVVQGLQTGADVAVAFALVVGAGLATTIGAAMAFCANLANKPFLAGSLGVSAGVMLYVSFVEIFVTKSIDDFEAEVYDPNDLGKPSRYATLCFFGGILITAVLDKLVHVLVGANMDKKEQAPFSDDSANQVSDSRKPMCVKDVEEATQSSSSSDDEVAKGMEHLKDVAAVDPHYAHLQRLGLLSGLAIALHNFPEGLATFVTALADKTSGAGIAFAIAIHNIPEGIVVAVPVYYATKSRSKAFFWAFMSGVSEPIGGVLGWVVLSNMGSIIYAVMFGVVAGMMVYISFKELIPTALRFDPEDKYVSKSVFAGMAIMAASLLLFAIGDKE